MSAFIDPSRLRSLAGDDLDSFLPIMDEFSTNGTQLIQEIHQAYEESDLELVHRLVHQLKGSSGMLGLSALFETCKKIESVDLKSEPNQLSQLQSLLDQSLKEAFNLLKT